MTGQSSPLDQMRIISRSAASSYALRRATVVSATAVVAVAVDAGRPSAKERFSAGRVQQGQTGIVRHIQIVEHSRYNCSRLRPE